MHKVRRDLLDDGTISKVPVLGSTLKRVPGRHLPYRALTGNVRGRLL